MQQSIAGKHILHYEIEAELGHGGMARVYRARDTNFGRMVAFKVLDKDTSAANVKRFKREALAASNLNHPNIVTVYEAVETRFGHCIVMELVEGHTLRDAARLSLAEVLSIVEQAAKALSVTHSAARPIIHRDIKPENIIVRPDGLVKIVDFGLAKALLGPGRANDTVVPTETASSLIGTFPYMSPEQLSSLKLTTATDIFSLGVVFYEIATGRHPFRGAPGGLAKAIFTLVPVRPSALNPEISPALDRLILQMLDKDPTRRPKAVEIAAKLKAIQHGEQSAAPKFYPEELHSVGRNKELLELQKVFDSATRESCQLLCISGEGGIGKTTLVKTFLSRLESAAIIHGCCSERLAATEAYLPMIDALDSLVRSDSTAAQAMKSLAPSWYAHVVSHGVSEQQLPADSVSPPPPRKRELLKFFTELSQAKQVVLFLDDLHWADASTIDALLYLMAYAESYKMLILAAYRPAELAENPQYPLGQVVAELRARRNCSEIELKSLTKADIERYLELEFPHHDFPPEFVTVIYDGTEGNPLFMSDLIRELGKSGFIVDDGRNWTLSTDISAVQDALPANIRALIESKINRLAENDRRLLKVAAVQGAEFDASVVAAVMGMDPEDVEVRLDHMDRVHHLITRRENEVPTGRTTQLYRFVHIKYQNVLYSGLLPNEKKRLSSAVAEKLLEYYQGHENAIASTLSQLFKAAHDHRLAFEYSRVAAKNAKDALAHGEAVILATRALEQLQELPDTPDRARSELEMLIILGGSLMATLGFGASQVAEIYKRAEQLVASCGTPDQELTVLRGLWAYDIVRANFKAAHERSNSLLDRAKQSSNRSLLVEAHHALGFTRGHEGRFEDAIGHHREALRLYDPDSHRSYAFLFALDPSVGCRLEMALDLWILGFPDQARLLADEGIEQATRLGNPYTLSWGFMFGAVIHMFRGELDDVRTRSDQAINLAREHGLKELLRWATLRKAWALVELGQQDEGITLMERTLEKQRESGSEVARPHFLAVLTESLIKAGRVEAALAMAEEGLASSHSTGAVYYEAELLRLQSDCFAAMGDSNASRAEHGYLDAIEIAGRQKAKSWELRATTSLARLLAKKGRRKEAILKLSAVVDRFTEGFDTRDLLTAKKLITGNFRDRNDTILLSSTSKMSRSARRGS